MYQDEDQYLLESPGPDQNILMSAIPETTGEDREDAGEADPEYYQE